LCNENMSDCGVAFNKSNVTQYGNEHSRLCVKLSSNTLSYRIRWMIPHSGLLIIAAKWGTVVGEKYSEAFELIRKVG